MNDHITGKREELFDIFEWIIGNEGRETSEASFSLDYGLEMLDDWLAAHDATVGAKTLREAAKLINEVDTFAEEWLSDHATRIEQGETA